MSLPPPVKTTPPFRPTKRFFGAHHTYLDVAVESGRLRLAAGPDNKCCTDENVRLLLNRAMGEALQLTHYNAHPA
jgi:hypothetical protein